MNNNLDPKNFNALMDVILQIIPEQDAIKFSEIETLINVRAILLALKASGKITWSDNGLVKRLNY